MEITQKSVTRERPAIAPIDWPQIIIEICRCGYRMEDVATLCQAKTSTVAGWKGGASPRHADGERLVWLWCYVTKNNRETVPRLR